MRKFLCGITVLLFLWLINAFADMSARKAIEESWNRYRLLDTEKELMQLTTEHKSGRVRQCTLIRYTKYDSEHKDKVVLFFQKPARDRGIGVLTLQNPDGNDDQWLYFPATKRIRRISDQKGYFQGTDFRYEDIRQLVGERFSDFKYQVLEQDDETYSILAQAKKDTKTSYGQRKFWIRKSDYVILQIDYFDKKNRLIKTQTNSDFKIQDSGLWRADKVEMENFKKKRKTTLVFTSREINPELKDYVFTKRFLESGGHN